MPCDHPKCSDDVHKTYTDDLDNDLELCEAHYYYLVSGEPEPKTRPTPDFGRPAGVAVTGCQPDIDIPDREIRPADLDPIARTR